jgi:hypothetical protein
MTEQVACALSPAPWRPWAPEMTGKRTLPRSNPRSTKAELLRTLDEIKGLVIRGEIQATLPADGFDPERGIDDLNVMVERFRGSEEASAMSVDERDTVIERMVFETLEKYPEPQRTDILVHVFYSMLESFDDDA